MHKPLAHPFTITVAANKPLLSSFSWAVWQHGGVGRTRSPIGYASFEEARVAGKAALDEMVAAWRHLQADSSHAADHPLLEGTGPI